jgi:hypothetical protein
LTANEFGDPASILNFNDSPQGPCSLAIWLARGDTCFLGGDAIIYRTQLGGINPDGTPGPALYQWDWLDNYSVGLGSTGGVGRLDADVPVDPGGTGGITILSIDGVPVGGTTVPEPPAVVLLTGGLLFLLRGRSTRAR